MNKRAGFTLLEVLVVVVIAISVTAFAVPAYKKTQERSKFLAAQGVLLDIGNAVLSLRNDLVLVDKNPEDAPSSALQLTTTHQNTSNSSYKSVKELRGLDYLALSTQANVGYALFARGYMEPVPYDSGSTYKGYAFYLCSSRSNTNTACCRPSQFSGDKVACMRKNSSCSTADYPGAYISEDGRLVLVDKTDTNVSTFCQ